MINLFHQEPVREQSAPQTLDPTPEARSAETGTDAAHAETIDVESIAEELTARSRTARTRADWARMVPSLVCQAAFAVCLLRGELMFAMLSLSALCMLRSFIPQRKRRPRLLTELQSSQADRRYTGVLAEAMEWPDRRVQRGAAALLKQQLPHLAAADAGLFTEEQYNCLYRRLRRRAALADPELTLTILRILPHIGTEAALATVERLAKLSPLSGKRRRVRNAARATLAPLEHRIAQQRVRQAALTPVAPARGEAAAAEAISEVVTDDLRQSSGSETGESTEISTLVDAQLQEFEQELRRLQKPGMRIGFLIASWGIILPYCAFQTHLQFTLGHRLAGLSFGVLTLLSTQLYRLTLTNQHRLIARKFAKLDDIRCVGRLTEALEWPDANVRRLAIAALTRLLPRIAASDAALLKARPLGILHRMLNLDNAANHPEFVCAILKALEQVGEEASIPCVEQLTKMQPTSPRLRRVRDAARECLPYLETRVNLSRNSQTLLRASSADVTPAHMLVRPAGGSSPVDEEQLLRPGPLTEPR